MDKCNLCIVLQGKLWLFMAILFLSFAFVPTIAAQCGNGIIDIGEECDDGNTVNGDCCDANCNFEPFGTSCGDPSDTDCTSPDACTGGGYCSPRHAPGGTPCTDDGNMCTDDECSGAGVCFHINNTSQCDDGLYCNGSDSCSDGACSAHTGDPCSPLFCDEGLDICYNLDSDTMCKGNFDYDQDVDGGDAFVFKIHFGRSSFKNPCPSDGPAPVEKTWQVTSHAEGDDGDHQKGVVWPNPRFTDNTDGTVTDKLTGLIWLKDANCFGIRTWDIALLDCNSLANGQCGLSDGSTPGDWRLANRKELFSLVDDESSNPALPSGHPFTNVQGIYWSSTNFISNADYAWQILMFDGSVSIDAKNDPYYVWPVRGGY